jgi:hypothetical protein
MILYWLSPLEADRSLLFLLNFTHRNILCLTIIIFYLLPPPLVVVRWWLLTAFKLLYLPQKLVLLPPTERQYLSVQKHVSSY